MSESYCENKSGSEGMRMEARSLERDPGEGGGGAWEVADI